MLPDMPSEDFIRVIDNLLPHIDPHVVSVIITGGEPLVRDDIEKVAAPHRGEIRESPQSRAAQHHNKP